MPCKMPLQFLISISWLSSLKPFNVIYTENKLVLIRQIAFKMYLGNKAQKKGFHFASHWVMRPEEVS